MAPPDSFTGVRNPRDGAESNWHLLERVEIHSIWKKIKIKAFSRPSSRMPSVGASARNFSSERKKTRSPESPPRSTRQEFLGDAATFFGCPKFFPPSSLSLDYRRSFFSHLRWACGQKLCLATTQPPYHAPFPYRLRHLPFCSPFGPSFLNSSRKLRFRKPSVRALSGSFPAKVVLA